MNRRERRARGHRGPLRKPGDFLPEMPAVLAELGRTPAPPQHVADQFAAASEENERFYIGQMAPAFQAVAGGEGVRTTDGASDAEAAFKLAAVVAFGRRYRWRCPHADGSPRPLVMDLTSGVLYCHECSAAGLATARRALADADDGRCDLCDEPGDEFYATMLAQGPLTMLMHICDACRAFSRQAQGADE